MLEVAQIITRKPSINYSKCLREDATTEIDLERLHQQYEQYLSLVGEAVPHHHVIEQDPAHPDCVFVEDTCVVLDHEHVVVTRQVSSTSTQVSSTNTQSGYLCGVGP